jgi:glucokinase
MRVLAGDIGGTHARLALVEIGDGGWTFHAERKFDSRAFDGLAPIVEEFRRGLDEPVEHASFGLACPIVDGVCKLTNLDWEIDASTFPAEIGIADTRLVNDFDCVGYAIPLLGADDLVQLQEGEVTEHGPIAVIGAGTGLGEGLLVWVDGRYRVLSSEGGHVDLAARDELEWRLVRHLNGRFGHVSCERALSGPGLANIYEFLVVEGYAPERPAVRQEILDGDAGEVISRHGLTGDDPLCVKALDLFVTMLGAAAGNLALTVRASAGLYVAGGIAPKILDKLADGGFLAAMSSKGRMSRLVEDLPVWVIVNPEVGLIGAAAAALAG